MSIKQSPARQKKRGSNTRIFEDDQLYSVRQVSEKISVTKKTIWEWIRLRGLATVKPGPNTTRLLGSVCNQLVNNGDGPND